MDYLNYFFIGLIWLFALNTVRLFLQEVRKRHIEVREWRKPNMLSNDFIVRDTIRDMFNPLIIMLIAAGILTVLLLNINWLGSRNSYIFLIALVLAFIISCFIATDRITWWAQVVNNYLTINFLGLNMKVLKDIPVADLSIERRSDGRIVLYNNDIRLFTIYPVSEAYDLMVEFLETNEVPKSTFESRTAAENVKVQKQKEVESEFETPPNEIVVRRSKRFLWFFLVLITLNILIIFIPVEFQANWMLLILIRVAIFLIALIFSAFLWKVTALDYEFQFRNRFGRRKSNSYYKISKVDVMPKTYHLYYDSGINIRRLLIIRSNDKNAKDFLAQLSDRGIPFYRKGMMVTGEEVLNDCN